MRRTSSPGSTTMASPEASSPRMEQLHCSAPTGRISWIMGNLDWPTGLAFLSRTEFTKKIYCCTERQIQRFWLRQNDDLQRAAPE